MKKVLKKFNRTLSIMLAAAMVLTMVPQTAMPVLAAEEGAAIEATADVGETSEGLSDEQNEEVTEPSEGVSDEGNSEDEGGDISNEDPSDEDPVEEEPSEGDAEEGENGEEGDAEAVDPEVPAEELEETEKPVETDEALKEVNQAETQATTTIAAPTITFSKANPANREEGVTATITAKNMPEGSKIGYTIGKTKPANGAPGTEYEEGKPVAIVAEDSDDAVTITVNAAVYQPAVEADEENGVAAVPAKLLSTVTTKTITFAKANPKVICEADAEKVEITFDEGLIKELGEGENLRKYIADVKKALVFAVAVKDPTGDEAKVQEIEKVEYKVGDAAPYTALKVTATGANAGKYVIPYTKLTKNITIKVSVKDAAAEKLPIEIKGTPGQFKISLTEKIGTAAATPVAVNSNKKAYVTVGAEVTATITPATANYIVKGVSAKDSKDADAEATVTPKNGTYTVKFTASADGVASLSIESDEKFREAKVYESDGTTEVPATKGVYQVDPRKSYVIKGFKGDGESLATITEAKITSPALGEDAATKPTLAENKESVTLVIGSDVAGKTGKNAVKIQLVDDAAVTTTLSFDVKDITRSVTVAKVSKGKLSQTIATPDMKYALTRNKGALEDELAVYVTDTAELGENPASENAYVKAEIKGNDLVLTTKAIAAKPDAAVITIVNTEEDGEVVATFTLTTTKPAWASKKPTVKLASATDIALNLTITLAGASTENSYYKIQATPKNENTDAKYLKDAKFVKVNDKNLYPFDVINAAFGEGEANKFDVTVTLYQTTDGAEPKEATEEETSNILVYSQPVTVKNLATKAPYYADKITLKKGTTTVYTGQKEVTVATVDFGKSTTYNRGTDVAISLTNSIALSEKYTQTVGEGESAKKYINDDGKIVVDIPTNLAPGKYTITAATTYPDTMVQATASMQITVVTGIENIEATSTPTIYKADKKAGTAKIDVKYNYGATNQPKTKKVTYKVGKMNDSNAFEEDANVLGAKMVTVKNGTVTVNKNYKVDADVEKNKFAVQVLAADYKGNTVADEVVFEVSATGQEFAKVVLKDVKAEDGKTLDLTALTADQLETIEVQVLDAKDDPVDSKYYTLTSTSKDLTVDKEGRLTVKKPVANVKIKATATDGSKNVKESDAFTVGYVPVKTPAVACIVGSETKALEKTTTVDCATGATIRLLVADKAEDGSVTPVNVDPMVNYKLSVTNATIISNEGKANQDLVIVMKGKTATVKLSEGKAVKETYTITNASFDKAAAPKISIKKGSSLAAKSDADNQPLTFSVNKAVTGATYVVASVQNTQAANLFNRITNENKKAELLADGKEFILTFGTQLDVVNKETIFFTFYDKDDNVLTKTTSVAIKTAALKKGYKLNAKYTMSAKDAAKMTLGGSGTNVRSVDWANAEVFNANIKGKENSFKAAFYAEPEKQHGTDGVSLIINDETYNLVAKDKNNLIGFVRYTVTYADGSKGEFTTKIQVNLLAATAPSKKNYAASAVTILDAGDKTGVTKVTAAKQPVAVAAALAEPNTTGAFEVASVGGSDITIHLGNAAVAGANKGKLYIIPADSKFANELPDDTNAAVEAGEDEGGDVPKVSREQFIKDNGIAVNITVTKKAADSTGKIKVADKDKKVDFAKTAAGEDGNYTVKIPYTVVIESPLKEETPVSFTELSVDYLTVAKVEEENAIAITLNSEKYEKAVRDDTEGKLNGSTLKNVEIKVEYKEAGVVAETFKVNITLRKLTLVTIEGAAEVEAGKDATYTVNVIGPINKATTTWSVAAEDGSTVAEGTAIDKNGKLTVAATQEKESVLVITATYGTKFTDTKEVTVKEATPATEG